MIVFSRTKTRIKAITVVPIFSWYSRTSIITPVGPGVCAAGGVYVAGAFSGDTHVAGAFSGDHF